MSIKKTLDRFDEILDSAKWAFRVYGNQNGFKDQNKYADEEINKIKQFITEEIKLATEEMLKSKTFPELESDDFDKGYAKAVEDFNSNFNKYFE